MSSIVTLVNSEVEEFVIDWYKKLDVHAPSEELLPLLADENLEMRFPEVTVRDKAGFLAWYERVTHIFFDEVHTMNELSVMSADEQANVTLVVNWQARIWNAPAPKSQWLGFDAAQRWVVKRSPRTGELEVVTYIVDALTPMPGSGSL
jgi:hypothetical protein